MRHYRSIFEEERLQRATKNSLFFAVISCFLTTLLAYAIAFGINRGGLPAPNFVRYATLTPLISPPVMIAIAAILLFGRQGAFTKGFLDNTLGWIDADVSNLYGEPGVVIAQIFSFLPAAFIIMDNVLSKHDGRVEEAAASMGASPWQVFTRITLPLSMPGLKRTVILVFILAMTDFGNPDGDRQGHSRPCRRALRRDDRLPEHPAVGGFGLVDGRACAFRLLSVGASWPKETLRHR